MRVIIVAFATVAYTTIYMEVRNVTDRKIKPH